MLLINYHFVYDYQVYRAWRHHHMHKRKSPFQAEGTTVTETASSDQAVHLKRVVCVDNTTRQAAEKKHVQFS